MINTMASALVGMNLLAWCMVVLRPRLFGVKLYRPMLLNIKLSIAPILVLAVTFLAFVLLEGAYDVFAPYAALEWAAVGAALVGMVIWVLLLPNAGYLITELNFNHRAHDTVEVPLWYDIVGVLALAMSGVMNMCFNVFMVQFLVSLIVGMLAQSFSFLLGWLGWLVMTLLMVLASFGIYLGRYIRFNSWDVKHPRQFLQKLKVHFGTAGSGKNCGLFVLFHALFFIVFYRATFGVLLEELLGSISFL